MNETTPQKLLGRLLSVDFGLKRVGMAITDPENRIAVGAGWIEGMGIKQLVAKVVQEARSRNADGIVIGMPSTTRGNDDVIRGASRLASGLEKEGFRVTFWAEGYTTAAALTARKFYGGKGGSDKGWADEAAAIILLQDYISWVKGNNG